MENHEVAKLLSETADLMEIDGQNSFRTRSYRNAVLSIENLTERLEEILSEPDRKLTDLPSVGKGMADHIEEICRTGKLKLREDLLGRYSPVALEMLNIQGFGPKGVALILSHFKVTTLNEVEDLARNGKLRDLPRMGEKFEQKILKAIESYRQHSGRYQIDVADNLAGELSAYLTECEFVKMVSPAGSLRRGCETIGDIDLLAAGDSPVEIGEHFLRHPKVAEIIAKGENKISVRLTTGIQVDLRMLDPESYGAAMQYFTGSKAHNVVLRERAKRMGYRLNEYGLFVENKADNEEPERVAGKTEQQVYEALKLSYIEPELRENTGEIEAAEKHQLPQLVTQSDICGDLHMHSTATDGRCSIEEMVQAANQRGLDYVAITDHSKALAMANGMNEKRVLDQIIEIRKLDSEMEDFRILAGIEVDILQDGSLDMDDEVLAQLDIVVGSVHSHMNQPSEQMTDRLLRALENLHLKIIGHPTGRLLLRREPFPFDMERIVQEAGRRNVAMEINSFPVRLDLRDLHVRLCKQHGVKLVISTDSHHTRHLSHIRYGVLVARRGWLEKSDVLNTLPVAKFLRALRRSA